jgi:hypothetical protein
MAQKTSTTPEATSQASSQVFNTPELVLIILGSLDELSLVRSQGINPIFHGLIQNTKSLRRRIGFAVEGAQDVIDTSKEDHSADLVWNPLLDWFITRAFLGGNAGLAEKDHITQARRPLTCNILPHALRAAQNPVSTIHSILITTKPADALRVVLSKETCETAFEWSSPTCVKSKTGVTIGQVFKEWAHINDARKRRPVTFCVPLPVKKQLGWSWMRADRVVEMCHADIVETVSRIVSGSYSPMQMSGLCDKVSIEHQELIRKFYGVCTVPGWFQSSMMKQRQAMTGILVEWKVLSQAFEVKQKQSQEANSMLLNLMRWSGPKKETEECKDTMMSSVMNYAAGFVLNRQDRGEISRIS